MAAVPPAACAASNPSSSRALLGDLPAFWPLWLIVAAAVFLRIYEVGSLPGLIGDEAWYGVQTQRLLAGTGGELRTPTGNVPGLIQMGSLALLHSLFQPSALLLRLPALLSSLAAMAVAYAIGRRFFGPASGMAALVLMASLPVNIGYARLGWDPSHAPLLVLAATYATLGDRRLLASLLFALALSNHPAAVFAAPFLTLAFLGFEIERGPWRSGLAKTFAFAGMLAMAVLLSLQLSPGAGHFLDGSKMAARLADPPQWFAFAAGICRLLSGDTIYTFITGQSFGALRPWADGAVALVLVAILVSGLALVLHRRDWRLAGIMSGSLASLILLFVVAGPMAVRPVFERFSFPMVPLIVLVIAVVLGRLLAGRAQKPWLQASLAALSIALLAGFWAFYVAPLTRGGNRPNPIYWVGLPELNQAAADRIAAAADIGKATVVSEDWWINWPVAYQLASKPLAILDAAAVPGALLERIPPGQSYWISYRGSRLDHQLARRADFRLRWTVEARGRKDALNIWLHGAAK